MESLHTPTDSTTPSERIELLGNKRVQIDLSSVSIDKLARLSVVAAGRMINTFHEVRFALRPFLPRNFRRFLQRSQPLALAFPYVRPHVAGLIYDHVEFSTYEDSSVLGVLAQIADMSLTIGREWAGPRKWTKDTIDEFAEDLDLILPPDGHTFAGWMRTHLDPEVAALEARLGADIARFYHSTVANSSYASIQRLAAHFAEPPGKVVRAMRQERAVSEPMPRCEATLAILSTLATRGPMNWSEVAKATRYSLDHVKDVGAKLKRAGYVDSIGSGRRTKQTITPTGTQLLGQLSVG